MAKSPEVTERYQSLFFTLHSGDEIHKLNHRSGVLKEDLFVLSRADLEQDGLRVNGYKLVQALGKAFMNGENYSARTEKYHRRSMPTVVYIHPGDLLRVKV